MPSPRDTNHPKYWRNHAAKMRAPARTMPDPIRLTDLANDYDKQAEKAAVKVNRKKPAPNGKPETY